jgi:hypothetical protein
MVALNLCAVPLGMSSHCTDWRTMAQPVQVNLAPGGGAGFAVAKLGSTKRPAAVLNLHSLGLRPVLR